MGRAFYDEYVTEFNWDAVDAEGSPQFLTRERIVRCRDCEHAITSYRDGLPRCAGPLVMEATLVSPDGFCSWGEPREEDE